MVCLLRAGIGSEEEVTQDSTHEALEGGEHFGDYEIVARPQSLAATGRSA